MPSFVGSAFGSTSSSTDVSVAWSAISGEASGDDAIVCWTGGSTQTIVTPPAGFTELENNTVNPHTRLYHRKLDGSESGSVTMSTNNSAKHVITLWVVRGLDPTTPINARTEFVQSVAGTTHDAPSVTPTVANCAIVVVASTRGALSVNTLAPPTSFTSNEVDTLAATTGAGATEGAIASDDLAQARAANVAVDPGNWTSGDSIDNVVLYTIALAPLAGGEVFTPRPTVFPTPRLIRTGILEPFQIRGDRAAPAGAPTEVSLTDTGSGADTLAVTADIPLSDTGSGADDLAVTATVPLSDTGTGVDTLSVTATITLSDTGMGDDVMVSVGVPITLTETATGTDSLTVSADIPLADTGVGVDSLSITATVLLDDTGTGVDVLAVQVQGQVDPYQAGPQAAWMFMQPSAASQQLRGDRTTVYSTTPQLPDSAAAADQLTVTATIPLSDTGTGLDSLTVTVPITLTETGTATDALTVTSVSFTMADTAVAVDALSIPEAPQLAVVSRISTGTQMSRASTGTDQERVATGTQMSRSGTGTDARRISTGHQMSRIVSTQ